MKNLVKIRIGLFNLPLLKINYSQEVDPAKNWLDMSHKIWVTSYESLAMNNKLTVGVGTGISFVFWSVLFVEGVRLILAWRVP